MTWQEVESAIEQGNTTVLVPTAATEQHGPGLPIGTDTFRANELGARVADELDCILAPTIRPGLSSSHMSFAGTITLSEETFERVVRDYCESLSEHGFENIPLITCHGGNLDVLESVTKKLDSDLNANVFGPVRRMSVPDGRSGYRKTRFDAMSQYGVSEDEAGYHAGAAEASAIMETYPELVDEDNLEVGHLGRLGSANDFAEVTQNGALGDQTLGSRAAGRTIIDEVTQYYADMIDSKIN